MSKHIIPASVLALALALAPGTAQSQLSASMSFHLGLFDGAGMGMAAHHWGHQSIFRPGFSFRFGASVGVGIGINTGYQYAQGWDPYWGDPYSYIETSGCWECWSPWQQGYDPYYSSWWGNPDPWWWGGGGFHISLGFGWNYYRRPVYFDPWWGHTGYLARWRPVWSHNPGWWYYNDPWYVSPGYSRVAYVVPAQGLVRVATPGGGYSSTTFKESPRSAVASSGTRSAKPIRHVRLSP